MTDGSVGCGTQTLSSSSSSNSLISTSSSWSLIESVEEDCDGAAMNESLVNNDVGVGFVSAFDENDHDLEEEVNLCDEEMITYDQYLCEAYSDSVVIEISDSTDIEDISCSQSSLDSDAYSLHCCISTSKVANDSVQTCPNCKLSTKVVWKDYSDGFCKFLKIEFDSEIVSLHIPISAFQFLSAFIVLDIMFLCFFTVLDLKHPHRNGTGEPVPFFTWNRQESLHLTVIQEGSVQPSHSSDLPFSVRTSQASDPLFPIMDDAVAPAVCTLENNDNEIKHNFVKNSIPFNGGVNNQVSCEQPTRRRCYPSSLVQGYHARDESSAEGLSAKSHSSKNDQNDHKLNELLTLLMEMDLSFHTYMQRHSNIVRKKYASPLLALSEDYTKGAVRAMKSKQVKVRHLELRDSKHISRGVRNPWQDCSKIKCSTELDNRGFSGHTYLKCQEGEICD